MRKLGIAAALLTTACARTPNEPESPRLPVPGTSVPQPESVPAVASAAAVAGVQQDGTVTLTPVETALQLLTRLLPYPDSSLEPTYIKFLVGGVDLCPLVILHTTWLGLAIMHPELPKFYVYLRDVGGLRLEVSGFSYYTERDTSVTFPREACHYPVVVKADPPSIDGARIYASEEECLEDTASWALGLPYPETPRVKRPIPSGEMPCWPWIGSLMASLRDPKRGKVDLTNP